MVQTRVKPRVKPGLNDDFGNIPGGNQGDIEVIPWVLQFGARNTKFHHGLHHGFHHGLHPNMHGLASIYGIPPGFHPGFHQGFHPG